MFKYRYDRKKGKRDVGSKHFPKHVRFITVSVQPKNIDGHQSSPPFYLTCLHLDHIREPHRLKEIDVIKRTIDSLTIRNEENRVSHIWVGDFNSLTKEDYTSEEWDDIATVRSRNCWERPHIDVTRKVDNGFELLLRPKPITYDLYNNYK